MVKFLFGLPVDRKATNVFVDSLESGLQSNFTFLKKKGTKHKFHCRRYNAHPLRLLGKFENGETARSCNGLLLRGALQKTN